MNEFDLIHHYFAAPQHSRSDVPVGIGDDCALVQVKPDHQLAITTDTMVEGIHFDARLSASDIGHKLMAVNLSDLAAMGAEPCWVSLALTLPKVDALWLAEFSQGLFALAQQHQISLIGGDTTRGPLTLTLTAQGQVPSGKALLRSGAQAGDLIFVSGHLGDAALALQQSSVAKLPQAMQRALEARLFRPTPRVSLGLALRGLASACIDISDGLAVDLGHILTRSHCGAQLELERIPVSALAQSMLGAKGAARLALSGGDDYELCFTAPASHQHAIQQAATHTDTAVTCIGQITQQAGLVLSFDGDLVDWQPERFMHFYD